MTLTNGFKDTPPRVVRTYNKRLVHDGYFIIDKEQFASLMWVDKKHLRLAATVPAHRDDAVLGDTHD